MLTLRMSTKTETMRTAVKSARRPWETASSWPAKARRLAARKSAPAVVSAIAGLHEPDDDRPGDAIVECPAMGIECRPDEAKGREEEGAAHGRSRRGRRGTHNECRDNAGRDDDEVDKQPNYAGHRTEHTEGPAIRTDDHDLHDGRTNGLAFPRKPDEEVQQQGRRDRAEATPEDVYRCGRRVDFFEVRRD